MKETEEKKKDVIALRLMRWCEYTLIFFFGLLPLFFIPSVSVPFEFTKTLFALCGAVVTIILVGSTVLRTGDISFSRSLPIIFFFLIFFALSVSALLSGDTRDSFFGDALDEHSALFVGVLAIVAFAWTVSRVRKEGILMWYMLLGVSGLVVSLFHIARFIAGTSFLSFQVFVSDSSSLMGSWNDTALYLGLAVIISLISLRLLSLKKSGKIIFYGVIGVSLVVLSVINFFYVWVVLAFVGGAVFLHSLKNDDRASQLPLAFEKEKKSAPLLMPFIILLWSLVFAFGGTTIGGFVGKYVPVSYVEVRPSFEATIDIARHTFHDRPFLGIGPNRFADAWRLHKDESLNATPFWNTDFQAGSGYIPTFFITGGVIGGVVWILLFLIIMGIGGRVAFFGAGKDRVWYFIGVSSFAGSLYIWGMSFIYVPGTTMLLLGASFIGVLAIASRALFSHKVILCRAREYRGLSFAFSLGMLLLLSASVWGGVSLTQEYRAISLGNKATISDSKGNTGEAKQLLLSARELSKNDVYSRRLAEYSFTGMNSLLSEKGVEDSSREAFIALYDEGRRFAKESIARDGSDPRNWATYGALTALLIPSSPEAFDLANTALVKARDLNPHNPIPYLELALLHGKAGMYEEAKKFAKQSISLRPQMSNAYYYLSELEIVSGNIDGALASALALAELEPQNPLRYYQLGILYTSLKKKDLAIASFEQAVRLEPTYSNALYLLAFAYDAENNKEAALQALEKVATLNPENADLKSLIASLKEGKSITQNTATEQKPKQLVSEREVVQDPQGKVNAESTGDSPLITPLNQPQGEHDRQNAENE